ncbi:hypothetical protein VDG1235_4407 [Verrucomicrobiia bacterium DG1235]|nr:hypothetical protein VDG1235_4407 [Verrucomicrobiae bacterium DG1235]
MLNIIFFTIIPLNDLLQTPIQLLVVSMQRIMLSPIILGS